MPPIRVLIVDDSVVIRKILTEELASDPDVEVAASASSGNVALAKLPQINPDVVTLDIEMPGLNGLETLAQIRKVYPKLPVIMFSTLTERGASATLDALSLGASDYVTKPSNSDSSAGARAKIRVELLQKIKSLVRRGAPTIKVPARRSLAATSAKRIDLVAIGTSTGGPNALFDVLTVFPKDFPVPIVIVQHMPPLFTRLLAERLNSRSNLSIHEGAAGIKLEPGTAWIAPGDYHMTVKRAGLTELILGLNQEPPENSCRPAVDVLFRSVAELHGLGILSVVMTGMGADGTRGARLIREAGGEVLIQDEATSVVWGMPGTVAEAGLADAVYPLDQLGPQIIRRVEAGHKRAVACGASNAAPAPPKSDGSAPPPQNTEPRRTIASGLRQS